MKTKTPVVAGRFYPADKEELRKTINKFINKIELNKDYKDIKFAIAPHAGYVFSGQVAAYTYKVLQDSEFDSVIVISPSHYEYFEGFALLDFDYYETPLGKIELNRELMKDIMNLDKGAFYNNNAFSQEHALEVQLPFLQYIKKDFKLVPLIMGNQNDLFCDKLAEIISKVRRDNVAVIASSDLSHFYPKFVANSKDKKIIESVDKFDEDLLRKYINEKDAEACGAGPIISVMKAAKKIGCTNSAVLNYADSGDVYGDNSSVVGYFSGIFY